MPESFHFFEFDHEAAARERRAKDRVSELPDGFTLCMSGRCGYVYYREGARLLEAYVEISGVPHYDLLVWSEGFTRWVQPSGVDVPAAARASIEDTFRVWLKAQRIRTDF
jgi:hypothetical protein